MTFIVKLFLTSYFQNKIELLAGELDEGPGI